MNLRTREYINSRVHLISLNDASLHTRRVVHFVPLRATLRTLISKQTRFSAKKLMAESVFSSSDAFNGSVGKTYSITENFPCREFYYIQMEKYARQAVSEGVKNVEDLRVGGDSEIYRVLNLHYNRNNHIEVWGPQVRNYTNTHLLPCFTN